MNNNPKIITCNIIVAILAIVSIITLCTGNFFRLTVTVNVTDQLLNTYLEDSDIAESNSEFDYQELFDGIDFEIPLTIQIKSATLLKSITGKSSEAVQALMSDQIDVVVDNLLNAVDKVVESLAKVVVNTVVERAEEEIYNQLQEELGGNVTEEQVQTELESEYGVSQEDIETLQSDLSNTLIAFLNGDTDDVSQTLEESETLDNLVNVYAEQALIEESGEGSYTQAQIDAKAVELKDQVVNELDENLEKFSDGEDFNKESVIVGLINQAGIDEDMSLNNMEEVKTFLSNKMYGALGDEAESAISMVLKGLGAFLLIVILSWAYLILKIFFKFFARNKTVGMFVPKFFGWMPYVLFAGIPNLFFRNLDKIIDAVSKRMDVGADTIAAISQYSEMVTIKFSSATWVSAVCCLVLFVLWFPYHKWRRQEKDKKKMGQF
ncbi:MAG: hypothetical protein PHI19_01915 [Clostridia bacterium]|nr:hypothetical protein [Clostridia bacterium]